MSIKVGLVSVLYVSGFGIARSYNDLI